VGRKLGVCPFCEGSWVPNLAQCGRGRGLPPCQVSSWSIQPSPTWQADRQHRQRSDSTGRTVVQTVARKLREVNSDPLYDIPVLDLSFLTEWLEFCRSSLYLADFSTTNIAGYYSGIIAEIIKIIRVKYCRLFSAVYYSSMVHTVLLRRCPGVTDRKNPLYTGKMPVIDRKCASNITYHLTIDWLELCNSQQLSFKLLGTYWTAA